MKKNYTENFFWNKKVMRLALAVSLVLGFSERGMAQTYCTPSNTSSSSYYIASVTTTGGTTNISNTGTTFSTGGYGDYTAMTATTAQGNSMTLAATAGPAGYTYVWAVWADWNHDGDFDDAGETIYTASSYVSSITTTFTIPLTALSGNTRLRVRDAFISPVPPACGNNTWGEAEDYTLIIGPPNNAGVRTLVSPDNTPFCSNVSKDISVSVVNQGSNALNSATINWSLDGVMQTPFTLPAPLPNYNDSVVIVLDNIFFANTTPKQLKAWTSMPNGVADTKPADDTLNTPVVAALQGVDVTISPQDTTICSGTTISLDAGEFPFAPIYIWDNGILTQNRQISTSGTYSVKVQNNMGCFDRDTVTVTVHPDPLINSIAIIDNGDGTFTFNVIGAQNIDSYTWDFDDGSSLVNGTGIPGQQIHGFTVPGEYNVTLTLRNQCGEIVATRLIKIDPPTTGIDNISALQKEISIYPNPSRSKVTISNKVDIKMKEISIVNLMGQQVYKNEKVNATQVEINTTGFAAGIYNVMINTEKGMVTKKLEIIN